MRIPLRLAILLSLSSVAPAAAQTAGASRACQPPPPDRAEGLAREARLRPIVDTVGMELMEAARTAGISEPAGLVVVEVRNRRTGEARTSSYRSNLPDALLAEVVARRAALLARMPDGSTLLHVRLDPLPAADSTAGECMPALEDREVFGREMSRIVRQVQAAGGATGPTRLTLHIRMLVTRDGYVAHTSLTRRSSRSDVDREVLQFTRRLRFHPARARGVPVDVWVEQPLQVDLPPPLRRTP